MKKIYVLASLREDFDFDRENANIDATISIRYIDRVVTSKKEAFLCLESLKRSTTVNPAILVYDAPSSIPNELIH